MEAIEAKIVEQKFLDCNFSFPRKLLENVNVNLAQKQTSGFRKMLKIKVFY